MPPKKHNAFMMFVHEWRNKNGRKMTIPQAVHQCGEIWMNMNPQQRGPYNASAKKSDVAERCKVERLNCHGQPLSMVEREERQAAEQHMQMKRSIERMVLNGKAQHDLENTKFIFAAFNYFTKAISNDIYIPAEFAACQFSLKSGIISLYSSHINPGQLIFGQASDAQHHTSTTHQLPLPPNAMGESNMGRLYGAIIEYLRGCYRRENPNEPLAVFTTTELMPVVEGCLRYVESDTEEPMEKIHVYDIQYLFYVLKKEVMDIADLPQDKINKSITDNLFLNDFFEYQSGISCQFHEDNDRSKYCAHSMVTRWCYLFSDYMCGDLAIKPLPGKHMPPKQEPMFRVTNPELSSVDYTSSLTSLSSVKTEVKREPDYVPADHSAFTADLSGVRDFPALGGHRSTRSREHCRNNMPSNDAKDVWNVPSTNRCVRDLEDAFNMPRR